MIRYGRKGTADRRVRTVVYTVLALMAFAANSIFSRLALGSASIDAASFTTVRLVSGAVTLLLISALFNNKQSSSSRSNWVPAVVLFLYAVTFSYAYLSLTAGTGALILFGAVQATMIVAALRSGERPRPREWLGLILALAGLVSLVLPGLTAPPITGSILMAIAGISWGIYSLLGRGAGDSLADTTTNFILSVPFAIGVSIIMLKHSHLSTMGVFLAVMSGTLASGIGYVVWYGALKGLTATRAAIVQLSVPILAAAGGVVFISEAISMRLLISAIMILGGVVLAVANQK